MDPDALAYYSKSYQERVADLEDTSYQGKQGTVRQLLDLSTDYIDSFQAKTISKVYIGKTVSLYPWYTKKYPNARPAKVKPLASNLTFRPSDPSVASVSSTGAVKGLTSGKTTITVEDQLGHKLSRTIRVTPQPVYLAKGKTFTYHGVKYRVIRKAASSSSGRLTAVSLPKKETVSVPNTVTYKYVKYRVNGVSS